MSEGEEKIHYQCQRCAKCCKWPGDVNITDDEADAIAEFLGLPIETFLADYTRLTRNRRGLSIIDKPNGECVFLEGIDCRIQKVKPGHCAGFPNTWNFPGWRKVCEAIPVRMKP